MITILRTRLGEKMGFLSFFMNYKKDGEVTRSPSDVSFDNHFLHIPKMGYFGFYKKSPSGEWAISWIDSDRARGIGGFRDKGNGRIILYNLNKNEITLDRDLQRPNNGNITNTGFCSIEDWLHGSGLKGKFYVFSPDGKAIIERSFSANLYNNSISPNGLLAVCQTANAEGPDGNKLTAFDLISGQELFSVTPHGGWANIYEFDEEARHIIVVHNGIGKYRYDLNGTFLDGQKFEEDKLSSEDYVAILLTIEEKLKETTPSSEELFRLMKAIIRAKTIQPQNPNGWDAIAFKLEGFILERLGDHEGACHAYEMALELNPKIGVARVLKSLRKNMETKAC